MEILVLAIKLGAMLLVLYGGVLCLWHRASERPGVRRERIYRGRRNMRLISEIGKRRAREPQPAPLAAADAGIRVALQQAA